MTRKLQLLGLSMLWVLVLLTAVMSQAQTPDSTPAPTTVPHLVRFAGVARDLNGKSMTGIVGVTFSLYSEQTGSAPLWLETQNVQADANGHYSALLGSTKPDGLPAELFTSEQARWVGVQISGQDEQPRVLLVSAPYALKAVDAETIGGLPPSAFQLAAPSAAGTAALSHGVFSAGTSVASAVASTSAASKNPSVAPATATPVTTTGGMAKFLPIFNGASTIIDSAVYQTGTGATAKVGIGTKTPRSVLELDVAGAFEKLGPSITLTNVAGGTGGATSIDFNTFTPSSTGTYNPSSRIEAVQEGTYSDSIFFEANKPGATNNGLQTNMVITPNATVGIGTATPRSVLEADVAVAGGLGPTVTLTNSGGGTNSADSLDFNTYKPSTAGTYNPAARIVAVDGGNYADGILFQSNVAGAANNGMQTNMTIVSTGQVVIPNWSSSFAPFNQLTVNAVRGGAGLFVTGWSAAAGSGSNGGYAIEGNGGSGDPSSSTSVGSFGALFVGGNGGGTGGEGIDVGGGKGGEQGGNAGSFNGGQGSQNGGIGLQAYGGFGVHGGVAIVAHGGGLASDGNQYGEDGIDSTNGTGTTSNGYAGNFNGNLNVTGAITAGTKDFKIDHPLDPANKYLVHASVESSEMKNIYDGNVTTDTQGEAIVRLPVWFEVLNTDFRYQLTVIGQFAQAIVAREIQNHEFTIRTSVPNVKVSWQVTGVRQDAYAKAHPLMVEEEKEAPLKGFYIHPELYGAPAEKQIEWARHPRIMKEMQQHRQQIEQKQGRLTASAKR